MENKFYQLKSWLPEILSSIKKDIKVDYLPASPTFYKTHFGNRPQSRLVFDEIQEAFAQELLSGNEEIAEWVVNRWVFKYGDIYSHFAERMVEINPEFNQIGQLDEPQSERVLKGAIESFGVKLVYFFSVLNAVVFPESIFRRLRGAVEREEGETKLKEEQVGEQESLAKILEKHQREVSRLAEKFEQKLSGMLKKYTTDVEALKSQVRSLQQKLAGKS